MFNMFSDFKKQLANTFTHTYTVCRQNGDNHERAMKCAQEVVDAAREAAK